MQPFDSHGRVVPVTTTVSPARAGSRPETPITVRDAEDHKPSFDEVYAAHYADLTVQLYAYFGDRQEAQDVGPPPYCRPGSRPLRNRSTKSWWSSRAWSPYRWAKSTRCATKPDSSLSTPATIASSVEKSTRS
jgi:hypothetical protein